MLIHLVFQVRLADNEVMPFNKGALLAFVNEEEVGSIGYHFEQDGAHLYIVSADASKTVGYQQFSGLSFPWKFAVGATYIPRNGRGK